MSRRKYVRKGRWQQRGLRLQELEGRRLLAADVAALDDVLGNEGSATGSDEPAEVFEVEDVNQDGEVTPIDALMVINALTRRRGSGGDDVDGGRGRDVNGDGEVTPLDALRIINRMNRRSAERQGGRNDAPRSPQPPESPVEEIAPMEVRSIDGTGNNLESPELGSAGTELTRVVDPDYADGISEPSGQERASAREISNLVSAQEESIENERGLSSLIWVWGQFIDHDIDLTQEGHDESFNIEGPTGDEQFDPFATGDVEISLTRSAAADGSGTSIDNPRQQVNEITSFLDGSMVYGSDQATADSLRSFQRGRLATSDGDLLPIGEDGFFQAGDVRANENVALTSMHTLWVREHNRIADEMSATDNSLSDEELYQAARAIVIGEIQAITFNEYLPALLGRDAIDAYSGYDPTVDPSISNLFATAAYRYGHTTLTTTLPRLDNEGNEIEAGSLSLQDAFFAPDEITQHGIESLLKGVSSQRAQEVDTMLIDDVRNFLFGPPGAGGFDLASLNIQRGRDHGLPDYNSVRESLGLDRAESFADISADEDVQARLAAAYESVDDIDVWVGALAEDHVDGASVGEMLQTVIADQFEAIRSGDRLWYQNVFEGEQLREISGTSLSDVIERNTDLTSIQQQAFFVDGVGPNSDRDDRDQPGVDRPDRKTPDESSLRRRHETAATDRFFALHGRPGSPNP
ncbi:MAG: peroxidase family protein [Planctomycetota bacterium]